MQKNQWNDPSRDHKWLRGPRVKELLRSPVIGIGVKDAILLSWLIDPGWALISTMHQPRLTHELKQEGFGVHRNE